MDGLNSFPLKALGAECHVLAGSFQCNATSNPSSTTFRSTPGFTFTVTYGATGLFTVTLPSNLKLSAQPASIVVTAQYDAVANAFQVGVVGDTTLNASARQFVIQAAQNTTGFAPANAAGNRINFWIFTQNSTGK